MTFTHHNIGTFDVDNYPNFDVLDTKNKKNTIKKGLLHREIIPPESISVFVDQN